jgi:hypothetical protein
VCFDSFSGSCTAALESFGKIDTEKSCSDLVLNLARLHSVIVGCMCESGRKFMFILVVVIGAL